MIHDANTLASSSFATYMAPLVVAPTVSTRWVGAGTDDARDGEDIIASSSSSSSSIRGVFEIEVKLPGVRGSDDIIAEVVTAGAQPFLSVLAMVEDGGEGGEAGTDYRADVPVPATCDAAEIAKVKYSKKKFLLTVRFNEKVGDGVAAAAAAAPPESASNAKEEEDEPPVKGERAGAPGTSTPSEENGGGVEHGMQQENEEDEDDEDGEEEDNPLAEYLRMLGAKGAMKGAAATSDAAEEKANEQEEDEKEKEKAKQESTQQTSSAADCPLCPPRDAPQPPLVRVKRQTAAKDQRASSTAATLPSASVLSAAIAAASTHVAGANNGGGGGVVMANGSNVTGAGAGGGRSNNKSAEGKKNRKKNKSKRNRGATGQLAPLKCIRTAKTMQGVSDMADDMAASLKTNGWAVAEFITSDAVHVVREEIKNIAPYYTDGEIWLGKGEAGAQISVKSVRGDRVFWMDPESVEAGRFRVLGEMLSVIDKLVLDELSRREDRLSRLADRTHAMLAEYPGRGSRFVRHVDNTARDGRRLTVLCYLNPEYKGEDGGALKVYPADDDEGMRGEEVAPIGGTLAMVRKRKREVVHSFTLLPFFLFK